MASCWSRQVQPWCQDVSSLTSPSPGSSALECRQLAKRPSRSPHGEPAAVDHSNQPHMPGSEHMLTSTPNPPCLTSACSRYNLPLFKTTAEASSRPSLWPGKLGKLHRIPQPAKPKALRPVG